MKSPLAERPRVPVQRSSGQGKTTPKARLKSVVDGKRVNIPVLDGIAKGERRRLGELGDGRPSSSV